MSKTFYSLKLLCLSGCLFFAFFVSAQLDLLTDSVWNHLDKRGVLCKNDDVEFFVPFNKDTLLLAGYFYDTCSSSSSKKDFVYLSFDGGKSWMKSHFPGEAKIYALDYQKDGKIWMGGTDNFTHLSLLVQK